VFFLLLSEDSYMLELPGVGNPRTVQELCSLVAAHNPKLVFLNLAGQEEGGEPEMEDWTKKLLCGGIRK
jgi:hypothetical protein